VQFAAPPTPDYKTANKLWIYGELFNSFSSKTTDSGMLFSITLSAYSPLHSPKILLKLKMGFILRPAGRGQGIGSDPALFFTCG
jgi:hypothetical protein